eukprot:gene8319-17124_t
MKTVIFKCTFASAVIGSFMCFLPILLDPSVYLSLKSDATISLEEVMASTTFQFSKALAISAALPIVFDLVMDIIYFSRLNLVPGSGTYSFTAIMQDHSIGIQCTVAIEYIWSYDMEAKQNSKSLSPDDLCCTLNLLAFVVLMILTASIQIIFGDYSNGKPGNDSFILRVNFITVYVIIIAGLNSRYERAKMILNHVQKVSVLDLLDSLINCGYEAVDILNSLLTFEKLDQGNLRLNTAPLRVNLFIKNLCEGRGDRVKLSMDFLTEAFEGRSSDDPSVFHIHADEKMFDQVIQNLITNALECTPRFIPVTVDVTVIREEMSRIDNCCPRMSMDATVLADSSYTLQIAVKDSGSGLTKEQLESAFKNPFSFTAGVLQTHQGQGLGLWISKKVLELHGGSLTVHSDGTGRGTTHIIHMPVHIIRTTKQSSSSIWSSIVDLRLPHYRHMSFISMFNPEPSDVHPEAIIDSDFDVDGGDLETGSLPSIGAIGCQSNAHHHDDNTHTSRSLLNPDHLDSIRSVPSLSPVRTMIQTPSTCVPEVPRLSEPTLPQSTVSSTSLYILFNHSPLDNLSRKAAIGVSHSKLQLSLPLTLLSVEDKGRHRSCLSSLSTCLHVHTVDAWTLSIAELQRVIISFRMGGRTYLSTAANLSHSSFFPARFPLLSEPVTFSNSSVSVIGYVFSEEP